MRLSLRQTICAEDSQNSPSPQNLKFTIHVGLATLIICLLAQNRTLPVGVVNFVYPAVVCDWNPPLFSSSSYDESPPKQYEPTREFRCLVKTYKSPSLTPETVVRVTNPVLLLLPKKSYSASFNSPVYNVRFYISNEYVLYGHGPV